MLITLVVHYGLQLHQMDIEAPFLNGDLQEDVYMTQPEGFVIEGRENLVCKLKRSLWSQAIPTTLDFYSGCPT